METERTPPHSTYLSTCQTEGLRSEKTASPTYTSRQERPPLHDDGNDEVCHGQTDVRRGSELVPLEFHLVEPGIDEWIRGASDEDKYARLFEVTAAMGYYLTSNETGTLGGGGKRRRLVVYPDDQGNLLTCVNASQVADHALKTNFTASSSPSLTRQTS